MAWNKGNFVYKGYDFAFEYKRVKYLRLKFSPQGEFKLSVPLGYTKELILEFLAKNESWIEAQSKHFKKLSQSRADKIDFLGKSYLLQFDKNVSKTFFKKNELIAKDENELKSFLHQNALKIFSLYLKKWQKHFDEKVVRLSIKTMRTRWGSCNSKKGYINLNLKLIHKPLRASEYVILHELTHLKFPHHKKSFYAHLENLMPDFRQRELLLKDLA